MRGSGEHLGRLVGRFGRFGEASRKACGLVGEKQVKKEGSGNKRMHDHMYFIGPTAGSKKAGGWGWTGGLGPDLEDFFAT